MALALAPHVGRVTLFDESTEAVAECAWRLAAHGTSNVAAIDGTFGELVRRVRTSAGSVDVFVLFAVLEHMTIDERLTTLALAADVLAPDGVIVVAETPNRLLWHDYHTTETPFFGMLPDELALQLADSIRREELGRQLVPDGVERDRQLLLTRFGRGVSHHEFEAVFGLDVHRHVRSTGWDPALLADRPEYREERYLDRFLTLHEPHVSPCFSRYWLDLILQPGQMASVALLRPWPVHSMGSREVAITPNETAFVSPLGILRVDLPRPADRIVVNVATRPDHAPTTPMIDARVNGSALSAPQPRHDAHQRICQMSFDLPDATDLIEIRARHEPTEITSVLWRPATSSPAEAGPVIEPLLVHAREAPADRPGATPATASPPTPPLGEALHGTYVGRGRVLIRVRGGGRLLVSAEDLTLMPELVAEGGYDAPFTAFLRRTLGPDSTFVDVGANVGLFTVIGALHAWRGQVIAYEPVPELAALLRDNVQLNWLDGRITVRQVAVADRAGRRPFHFDPRLQILGMLGAEEDGDHVVDTVTLDADLRDVERIDLVKIDVEGGEADVLAGMGALIASGRVDCISCEVRSDAFQRTGLSSEWEKLVAALVELGSAGWDLALIGPGGEELARTAEEVVASEPHPNVVLRRPSWRTSR